MYDDSYLLVCEIFETIGMANASTRIIPAAPKFELTNLYPNPAIDQVTLHIETSEKRGFDFGIYNTNGQLVQLESIELSVGFNSISFSIAQLPAGMYTLLTESEISGSKQLRFVKQHF